MSKPPDIIRILHTADWHLGREFHGADLTEAHEAFFEWLIEQVDKQDINVILMAGDIYDRAYPPARAVAQLNKWLDRLSALVPIILISGNHDSAVRMGFGALLKDNITLRSGTTDLAQPVSLELNGIKMRVYPVPYLDPGQSIKDLELEERSHLAVLTEAIDRCRQDLSEATEDTVSVLVGHAFVTGGETADSERDIAVGGAGDVPAATFDGFDYVAMGHLHRPQLVSEKIQYSGSPLFLSFSEAGIDGVENWKSVSVVEIDSSGKVEIENVRVPDFRSVSRIQGSLDDLLINSEKWDSYRDHWLDITLTDDERQEAPMERLRHEFPHLLNIQYEKSSALHPEGAKYIKPAPGVSDLELAKGFIEHVRPDKPATDRETELLGNALEASNSAEGG